MSRRFDPPAVYAALDAERTRRRASWSQVAAEVGVSATTLKRLAEHGRFEVDGILAIAQWLDRPLEDFTRPGDLPPEALRS